MFDANGTYSPPDEMTRHVVVIIEAFTTRGPAGVHQFPVAAGTVTWEGMLGQTQVAHIGPPLPRDRGRVVGALIEHATAKVGTVLPLDEITAAVALAEQKRAAVRASITARVAAQQADAQSRSPSQIQPPTP